MRWRSTVGTAWLCLIYLSIGAAAAEPIAKLDQIEANRLAMTGIELKSDGQFTVKGVGLVSRGSDDFTACGWILDSQTRKPIWVMERGNTERKGREGLRQAEQKIELKPGKYELYYYAGTGWSGELNIKADNVFQFFGDLFEGKFKSAFNNRVNEKLDEFYISLSPSNNNFKNYTIFTPDGGLTDALVKFTKAGDSKYYQQGFKLDKKTTIRIYSLIEHPSGYKTPADYGWIVNLETGEKVWQMDRWNAEPAGGGRKNRIVDEEVELEKGSYILVYVTDDSHSYEDFNVMPPYDPLNWGVAILPTSKTDKEAFSLFEPPGRGTALVSLTRISEDESVSQAFKLDKEMDIKVVCLGEWAGEFADYGWIENAATGKTVWEMTYRNTEHAGGGEKNRKFEGVVTLPKGSYVVNYISDGSHSFDNWNDTPPYEPEMWGLAIFPGKDFDKSKFHLMNENQLVENTDILVKMTKLGDNVRKKARFTLSQQTKVRIYAVGEGDSDEMYDYGWIKNEKTGKVIWEMTYRNTEPAGGASKNRLYDDIVILDKGDYEVTYVTDGSHSFNDWNSAKPRDPSGWGITVSIDKGQTSAIAKARRSYSSVKIENPIYVNVKKADKHTITIKID